MGETEKEGRGSEGNSTERESEKENKTRRVKESMEWGKIIVRVKEGSRKEGRRKGSERWKEGRTKKGVWEE